MADKNTYYFIDGKLEKNNYIESIENSLKQYKKDKKKYEDLYLNSTTDEEKNNIINQYNTMAKISRGILESIINSINIFDEKGAIIPDQMFKLQLPIFLDLNKIYKQNIEINMKLKNPNLTSEEKTKLIQELNDNQNSYFKEVNKVRFAIRKFSSVSKKIQDSIDNRNFFESESISQTPTSVIEQASNTNSTSVQEPQIFDQVTSSVSVQEPQPVPSSTPVQSQTVPHTVDVEDDFELPPGRVNNINRKGIKRIGIAIKAGFTIAGVALVPVAMFAGAAVPLIIAGGVAFAPAMLTGLGIGGVLSLYPAIKTIKKGWNLGKNFISKHNNKVIIKKLENQKIDDYVNEVVTDIDRQISREIKKSEKESIDSIDKLQYLRNKCELRIEKIQDAIDDIKTKYPRELDKWKLDIEAKQEAIVELRAMIGEIDKRIDYIEPAQMPQEPTQEPVLQPDDPTPVAPVEETQPQTEPIQDSDIPTENDLYEQLKNSTQEELNEVITWCNDRIDKNIKIDYHQRLKLVAERILQEIVYDPSNNEFPDYEFNDDGTKNSFNM